MMSETDAGGTKYMLLQQRLAGAGYRMTGSRRALLRLVVGMKKPMSVPEIVEAVNATPAAERRRTRHAELRGDQATTAPTGDGINVVTVYRLVNLLVAMEILRRVEFGQGYYRYELAESQAGSDHHHHLVCDRCGTIEDFVGCADLAPLTDRIASESGFTIQRHQLELYGTCASCQEVTPASAA